VVGVCTGEAILAGGGPPETVFLHMLRLGDLVSGFNLLNEQHLDVTLDADWAITEKPASHFVINNKHILCYVNNVNKNGTGND